MKSKFSAGFSLSHTRLPFDKTLSDILHSSPWQNFEIPGTFFESEHYEATFKKFLQFDKKLFSVHAPLPPNITRNWSSTNNSIQQQLINCLKTKINCAADKGVKLFRIDFGLDSIKSSNAFEEIQKRTSLIAPVLRDAEKVGLILCQPLRVPKVYPSSQEWRYAVMLASQVLNNHFRLEIDVFPAEMKELKFDYLLKKLYYYPSVIRFRYEPAFDGSLKFAKFKTCMDQFLQQGFTGKVIFSPVVESVEALQRELNKTHNLVKEYLAIDPAENDSVQNIE